MPFAIIAALKDLKRRLTDPAALLMWIGLPVVIGLLMSLISGSNGPAPKAHLFLVDEDGTFVSGLIATAGRQGQVAQFLDVESIADRGVAMKRMDKGDASALLVVPKGFQDAVLSEQPTTLTLVKNPAQRILPNIIEEGLKMTVEATFYAQRLFGPTIQSVNGTLQQSGQGPSDDTVASISRAFNQRLRAVQTTVLPPVIALAVPPAPASEPSPGFWALFLPGLLFMALMFTAQGMSIDIWTEKTRGTLRRTLTTPQHARAFLAGKLLAGVGIMGLACLLALVLGVALFGVPLARAPIALLWTMFTGAALFCYLTVLQVVSTNARGAQLLSSLVVFPLIMIGGSFFPFEAMPPWMANIGRWTPNGLGVMEVKQILFGPLDLRGLAIAALGIGVPAIAAFYLGVRRIGGAFAAN